VFSSGATPKGPRDAIAPLFKIAATAGMLSAMLLQVRLLCARAVSCNVARVQFVGMFLPLFTFVYEDALGWILSGFPDVGNTRTMSLVTIGNYLRTGNHDGTVSSSFLFFVYELLWYLIICIMPLAHMATNLVLFWSNCSAREQRKLLFFAKACGYWAAVEIIVLAVVVLPFEVAPLILYIVNKYTQGQCGAATTFLERAFNVANCLDVAMTVDYGFAFVFLGVLLQTVLGGLMQRVAECVLLDREAFLDSRRPQALSPFQWGAFMLATLGKAWHLRPDMDYRPVARYWAGEAFVMCCPIYIRGPAIGHGTGPEKPLYKVDVPPMVGAKGGKRFNKPGDTVGFARQADAPSVALESITGPVPPQRPQTKPGQAIVRKCVFLRPRFSIA